MGHVTTPTEINIEVASTPRPTLAEQVRVAFLGSYRDGKTLRAYTGDLDRWFRWCASVNTDPLAARRQHIEAWVRQLERTISRGNVAAPASIHRAVSVVRSFYRYAVDAEILTRSPVPETNKHLNLEKVPTTSTTKGLTQDEATRFLTVAGERGQRDGAMAAVLLYQALRVGGLCELDVEDLSTALSHRTLTVKLKGGDVQVQALAPAAATYVDAWLASRTDPTAGTELVASDGARAGRTPLFTDKRGERVKYWNVESMVRTCAKRAAVTKKISPHSLRHTTITHLLDKGVPLRDVQELAGHENPATTIRYDRGVRNLNNSPVYKITGDFG